MRVGRFQKNDKWTNGVRVRSGPAGIINLPWFKNSPIVLFLNKEDLFIKKIKKVDIGIYFPSYNGACGTKAWGGGVLWMGT